MASQYSILRNYGKYVSPYNMDVMMQGMGYMQQKIDTNRQAINEYADYIINSDIAKPQDREYLQNRLNGLIQDVNNVYRKSNLASDGIARSIQARLGEALDTRVLNAVAGTREFRELSTKLEDMKLNNPKMYSPINESMALMPYYKWLNDGQVGTRLEPLHYTPYTDYNAEIDGKVKDFLTKHKGQKIQIPVLNDKGERTGEIIEKTIDEMGYSEIRNIIASSMSQNAKAQIQLEGQYMALTNPHMFNQQSTSAFIQQYVNDFDAKEKAIKAELGGVGNDANRKLMLETSLADLRNQKQTFIDEANSFIGPNYDAERAGAFMVQQEFLRGAAMRWSYNNSSVIRKADDYYYKEDERLARNAKFVWDQKMDKERLKIEQLKADAAWARAIGGGGSGMKGSVSTSVPGTSYTVPIAQEKVKPSTRLMDNIASNRESIKVKFDVLANAIGDNVMSNINAYIDNNPDDFKGMSHQDAVMKFIMNNNGAKYDGLKTDKAKKAYEDLAEAYDQRNSYYSIYDGAMDAKKKVSQNLDNAIMEEISNNPGMDIYLDNGENVNVGDMSRLSSVRMGGKFVNPFTAAKVSSLMSRLVDTVSDVIGPSYDPSGQGRLIEGRSVIDVGKAELILDEINESLGTDLTVDELDAALKDNITDNKTWDRLLVRFDGDKDKANLAYITLRNINREMGSPFAHKWSNSGPINRVLDDMDDAYNRYIESRYDEFGRKGWTFNERAKSNSEEFRLYNSIYSLANKSGLKLDKKEGSHTLSVEQDDDNNWWIIADAGEDKAQRVQVSEQDLAGIGFTTYTKSRNIPSVSYKSRVSGAGFSSASDKAYGRSVADLGLGSYATADNAKDDIRSFVLPLFPDDYHNDMSMIISAVIDGSSNYEVKAEGYDRGYGRHGVEIKIYKKGYGGDPSNNPLYTIDKEGVDYADNIAKVMNIAPQAYLVEALKEAMTKEANSVNSSFGRKDINEDLYNIMLPVMDIINKKRNGNEQ